MSIFTGTSIQGLGSTTTNQAPQKVLGKEDFMKLLVTQLSYQDPLNPMDGTEFSAQLAQFSGLEELKNINDSLDQSLDANYLLASSINNTLAATVIGRNVKAHGDEVSLNDGNNSGIHFNLSAKAKNVEVEIMDENGQVCRTITLKDLDKGEQSVEWDGKDNAGIKMADGTYQFQVKATDSEGESISAESYIYGPIDGVRYGSNGAVLMIGNLEILMSDVYEIAS